MIRYFIPKRCLCLETEKNRFMALLTCSCYVMFTLRGFSNLYRKDTKFYTLSRALRTKRKHVTYNCIKIYFKVMLLIKMYAKLLKTARRNIPGWKDGK